MDISFKTDNGKLNYRITNAIYNKVNGKFLLQKGNAFDFWVMPGGRCQMGELSAKASLRELTEELGNIKIINQDLLAVSENLFNFDSLYHELSFCYKIELDSNAEILKERDSFYGVESKDYIFKWCSLDEIEQLNLKPKFSLDILKDIANGECNLKHYSLNEL